MYCLLKSRNRSIIVSVTLLVLWVVIIAEWRYIEILKESNEMKVPQVFPRGSELKSQSLGTVVTSLHTTNKKTLLNCNFNMSINYEILRSRKRRERILEKSFRDFWWYARATMRKVKHKDSDVFMKNMGKRYSSLKWRYDQFLSSEEVWKKLQLNISNDLSTLMANRLHKLQNPANCETAKKLVCHVAKACGFGCQIHHVSYCFILAYASQRTLILDSTNWKYSPKGWNVVFKPISNTCTEIPPESEPFRMKSKALSVSLPPVDALSPRPKQLPMAIPQDIADRLMSFHGQPFAWFISQFLKLLMQPSEELKLYILEKKKALGIKTGPIVGLHVRRTDKKSEARYHEVSEYMTHVSDWYDWYDLHNASQRTGVERKVYIATDEPRVIEDAKFQYSTYKVYSDSSISSLASKTGTRYSTNSLFGLLFDVTILSECDYIVCTFSSQVCRLAYELMQKYHLDASLKYYSLDDIYYFGGQQDHNVVAIESHKDTHGSTEVEFRIGDELGIAGNEKNGYSVGINRRTLKRGQYPSYKVEDKVRIVNFSRL